MHSRLANFSRMYENRQVQTSDKIIAFLPVISEIIKRMKKVDKGETRMAESKNNRSEVRDTED